MSPEKSGDSLGIDTNILSGFGHAHDDYDRFMRACQDFTARSYYRVREWFTREFVFLAPQDREDAMHEFYLSLSRCILSESVQFRIREYKQTGEDGIVQFKRYLRKAARNAAHEFSRKRRRYDIKYDEDELIEKTTGYYEVLLEDDLKVLLDEIQKVASITPHEWAIFVNSLDAPATKVMKSMDLNSIQAVHAANTRVRRKMEANRHKIIKQHGFSGELILHDAIVLSNLAPKGNWTSSRVNDITSKSVENKR
ncbi:MAG: sigma-70 family RNA polymerase sigma factor [Planctomycetaceae bacterium]|nr:sigma-70 family RNA polymerase sigma factor [Planctomycetaceae bacterium]